MKKQTINGLTCTVTYHAHGDVTECVIECVTDSMRWSGYARGKRLARESAIDVMTSYLRDGYAVEVN